MGVADSADICGMPNNQPRRHGGVSHTCACAHASQPGPTHARCAAPRHSPQTKNSCDLLVLL